MEKKLSEMNREELEGKGWKSLDEVVGKKGAEKKNIDEMNRILPPVIKAMRDFRERSAVSMVKLG